MGAPQGGAALLRREAQKGRHAVGVPSFLDLCYKRLLAKTGISI